MVEKQVRHLLRCSSVWFVHGESEFAFTFTFTYISLIYSLSCFYRLVDLLVLIKVLLCLRCVTKIIRGQRYSKKNVVGHRK